MERVGRARRIRAASRTRRGAILGVALVAAALAASASAHVVVGRRTLRAWTSEAAVVVIADVVDPLHVWRAPDGSDHQEVLSLSVIERLRGDPGPDELIVFPHAEAPPRLRAGDRAVFFLERTAEHRSFAGLAPYLPWFTAQGAGDEWKVGPANGDVARFARAWATLAARPEPERVRALLAAQLRSRERRLREDSIAEIARIREAGGLASWLAAPSDAEGFARLLEDGGTLSVPERVALSRAIDGAGGFSAVATLREIVHGSSRISQRDRLAVVRAAGQMRDEELSRWLGALLEGSDAADAALKREAASALGHPWHEARVSQLARAASAADQALARSAVQALAGIGSEEATRTLTEISRTAPAAVAAVARAQLARRGREAPRASTARGPNGGSSGRSSP